MTKRPVKLGKHKHIAGGWRHSRAIDEDVVWSRYRKIRIKRWRKHSKLLFSARAAMHPIHVPKGHVVGHAAARSTWLRRVNLPRNRFVGLHEKFCLTLALPGMQHKPRRGLLLLHVRAEQPVNSANEEVAHAYTALTELVRADAARLEPLSLVPQCGQNEMAIPPPPAFGAMQMNQPRYFGHHS